ncbi:MAG: hypothetical protein ACK4MD_11635 [Demequina sp.]
MADDDHDVVPDDLLTDERKWRDISEVVEQAHTIATGLESMPDYVTDGLSYAMGFQGQYGRLASQAVTYVGGGVEAMRDIADRLRATHDEYVQSEDDAAQESLSAEWA